MGQPKRRTKPRDRGGRIVTLTECAGILGLNAHTVSEWMDRGAPGEKDSRGRWQIDMASITHWMIEDAVRSFAAEVAPEGDGAPPPSLKARAEAADVAMKEFKLAQMQEEWVRVDDAIREAERANAETRTALLAVPARLAQELDESQRAALDREIRDALSRLSGDAPDDDAPAPDGEDGGG